MVFKSEIIQETLPLTLETAKLHLRVGDDEQNDSLIKMKIEMAISIAENMTNRHIRRKRLECVVTTSKERAFLPVYCSGIDSVKYGEQVLSTDKYWVQATEFATMLFVDPCFQDRTLTVSMTVGYDESNCPPSITAAILFLLGTLYDNEADNIVGRSVSQLSLTAEKLLAPHRIPPYGDV